MSGPQFFETGMGKKYYDGTMPRIAKALEAIAKSLETKAHIEELEKQNKDYDLLVAELVDMIHDHDTAWDNEEDSVKEEHAGLIARTRVLLERLR